MTFSSPQSVAAGELPIPRRTGEYTAAILIALAVAAIVGGGWLVLAGFAAASLVFALLGIILFAMFKGKSDQLLVGWVFLYPLGYYLLSYPRDRPVIQFDRVLIAILIVSILAAPRSGVWTIPRDLKRSAIAWSLFLGATCISLLQAENVLTVGRMIVDAFLLPSILGWYIVRQFRLRGNERWLHTGVCVISFYCAAIGVMEIAQQRDLFEFQSNLNYVLSDSSDLAGFSFLRPNGPFMSNSTFALAGFISFVLLRFLWTFVRNDAGLGRRSLHILGTSAALLQSMLPVFRHIFLTLFIVAVIDLFSSTGGRRWMRLAFVGLVPAAIIAIAFLVPSVSEDRASGSNISGRFTQGQQTWRIFVDHPWFGIGLQNFPPVAVKNLRYQVDLGNEPPLNNPHNNIGAIAAETGIVGLTPFLLSQIFLAVAFWSLAKRSEQGRLARRFFVYIFLSYLISGMAEGAAEYGELNMWFVFAVALLYRYGCEETAVVEFSAPSAAV